MFRVTCVSRRLDGGAFHLSPGENELVNKRAPVVLRGSLATIWEQMLVLHELTAAEQRTAFGRMERSAQTRFAGLLATFYDGGLVELHPDDQPLDVTLRNPQLLKLHLELTHRCNFSCKACYLGHRLRPSNGEYRDEGTTEDWIRVIRDGAELGCSFATVTGGEPFLRKDIFDILEALSNENIISEINTNGSVITPQIADKLTSVLISSIAISIYGHDRESAHQYTNNGAGNAAALKAIRLLKERRLPMNIKYFSTLGTAAGADRLRRELEEIGVNLQVRQNNIHGDIFQGRQLSEGWQVLGMERSNVVQKHELPCHPSRSELTVEPNGNIRACPKISVYFGNAFETGLKEVWRRSSEMAEFRKFWIDYCEEEGFVKNSTPGSLCPASKMLSRPNGYRDFQKRWNTWQNGGQLVQIDSQR
jgi:MoaA/NifB/PqqE/SkfB family radical SAM enzyme